MVENKQEEKDYEETENDSTTESENFQSEEDIEISEENDETEEISEETEDQIKQFEKEKEDLYDRLLRVQAEFDNFKRRTEKERAAERKYESQDLANELLPVLDNFERALQVETDEASASFVEGITMVYRQLTDALKTQDITAIESVGEPFDPNLHHAVMQVEDENYESNIVTEELQKGYLLKDRVLRPSMVKVNK